MDKILTIKQDTPILTMNFFWSKGENKLHLSILWKPVIYTQGIKKKKESSACSKMMKCT